MKSSLVLIVPFFLLTAAFSNAQTTTTYTLPTETAKGESTIRGHAIYDDTEKPVRRVGVSLIDTASSTQRLAVTDGNGDFVFKNVAAGTYRVAVDFAGRLNGLPSNELAKKEGEQVTVDGSSSADLRIRAIRGASITGRVTYPDGEPAIGAQINVFRRLGKQWTHAEIVTSGTETDDRGIFRIYPLRAGEYAISAIERSMTIEERNGSTMQTVSNQSLNPYFYQDAPNLKNATVIQVDAGRETTNINFTLTERPVYEVSGSITLNEKPLLGVYLRLDAHDDGVPGPTLDRPYGLPVRADKDGHWSFKNIPDGTYDIELDPNWSGDSHRRSYERYLATRRVVTVSGADLSDISINLTEAGRISGSIVMEGNKLLPKLMTGRTESIVDHYHSARELEMDQSGKFVMGGVAPGENLFSIDINSKFYVKSITWKGRDLLRQPIKVEAGQESSGVVVVLSTELGTLSGRVLSPLDRKPLGGVRFMLLPVEENRGRDRLGMRAGVTNEDGLFKIEGPPGEYFMVVMIGSSSTISSFDAFKEIARRSPRVTLKTTLANEVEIIAPN
jgi:hypothetical protein